MEITAQSSPPLLGFILTQMELYPTLPSPQSQMQADQPTRKKHWSIPLKLKKPPPTCDQPPEEEGGMEKQHLKILERQDLWDFSHQKRQAKGPPPSRSTTTKSTPSKTHSYTYSFNKYLQRTMVLSLGTQEAYQIQTILAFGWLTI